MLTQAVRDDRFGALGGVELGGDHQAATAHVQQCVVELLEVAEGVDSSGASLSPDGRWLAYAPDVSGRTEVMVRRFPDGTRDVRVSAEGGSYPLWDRDGREILFRRGDSVFAVPVSVSGDELTPGRPRVLFRDKSLLEHSRHSWSYDRTTDELIMIRDGKHEISRDRFVVLTDWPAAPDTFRFCATRCPVCPSGGVMLMAPSVNGDQSPRSSATFQ